MRPGERRLRAVSERSIAPDTLVSRVYNTILSKIGTDRDYLSVLESYMPLLLTELDTYAAIYKELKRFFVEMFRSIWDSKFPEIPAPDVSPEEPASTVYMKVYEALKGNLPRILRRYGMGPTPLSSSESEVIVKREALAFMDTVLRTVFRHFRIIP